MFEGWPHAQGILKGALSLEVTGYDLGMEAFDRD